MLPMLFITLIILAILTMIPNLSLSKKHPNRGPVHNLIFTLLIAVGAASLVFIFRGSTLNGYISYIGIALNVLINVTLLKVLFRKMEAMFNYEWLRYFFYTGIFFVIVTSIGISATLHEMIYESILYEVLTTAFLVVFSSIGVGILAFIVSLVSRKGDFSPSNSSHHTRVPQNRDMMQHYYDQGLTAQEVDYFREQMAAAKQQIITIETEFNRTAKLRAIEVRYNTVQVCQNFFKDLVEEPNRMAQAGQFLYKFLPSLEDLILKYNEINGHVAKNKQTYLILEKSAQTIENICEQITDEYVLFHQETYQEMQDEITLANRNLSRKETRKQFEQGSAANNEVFDSVDDILKESDEWLSDNKEDTI